MLNPMRILKFSKKETSSNSGSKKKLEALKQLAKINVFSNTEILIFVFLFITLAGFLFPKEELTKTILNGKENLNIGLSKVYIESLLKIKKDPDLILILIKDDIKSGNIKEAEKLLKELKNLKNSNLSEEKFLKLKLAILEKKYFLSHNRGKIKRELRQTLKYLVATNFKPDTIEKIYNKSIKFGFNDIAYLAAEKLSNINSTSINWHEKAFDAALAIKNYNEAFKHLNFLIQHSKGKKKNTFIKKALILSLSIKDYDKGYFYGEELLKSKSFTPKEINMLINMALSIKDYDSAFKYAYKAFKITEKKQYFKKATQIALWAGKKELVKHLIENYGIKYLKDPNMALFLLKTSMALNDKELSQELAEKAVKLYGSK